MRTKNIHRNHAVDIFCRLLPDLEPAPGIRGAINPLTNFPQRGFPIMTIIHSNL
ncbi:MAG: hypothetical protein IH589_12985 [Anaerolineales bacterium]|nr:hypothetical protein [Anaerolineales bacterium]